MSTDRAMSATGTAMTAKKLFQDRCGHLEYCRHSGKSAAWCMKHCITARDHSVRDKPAEPVKLGWAEFFRKHGKTDKNGICEVKTYDAGITNKLRRAL
jgi:hypothetical protein